MLLVCQHGSGLNIFPSMLKIFSIWPEDAGIGKYMEASLDKVTSVEYNQQIKTLPECIVSSATVSV